MKRMMNRFSIMAIALVIGSGIIASYGLPLTNKNPANDGKTANLIGRYVYRGKQGETFYEFTLKLKEKNVVSYKSDYTGGAGENSGVWSFDEKKNLLTVKIKIESGEETVMKFKTADGNLEVVEKSEDLDPVYGKGTVFKKL